MMIKKTFVISLFFCFVSSVPVRAENAAASSQSGTEEEAGSGFKQHDVRYTDEDLYVPMEELIDREQAKQNPLKAWGAYQEIFNPDTYTSGRTPLYDEYEQ